MIKLFYLYRLIYARNAHHESQLVLIMHNSLLSDACFLNFSYLVKSYDWKHETEEAFYTISLARV